MPKKKSKALTKRDVAKICNKLIFARYANELMKNIKKLQRKGLSGEYEMQQQFHNMQTDTSILNLDLKLSKLSQQLGDLLNRVLIQDYIIGRLSKAELIVSLRELHPNDPLSTTEHLENIDRQKDAFEEHIKNVSQ